MFSWLSLGNLRNRGNAGLWYVNGNNGTGNTRWNIGSRLSGKTNNQLNTSAATTRRAGNERAMAWVNDRNGFKTTGTVAVSATSQTASREKRSEQLKSYCKGLRIDGALISRAYESWLDAPAGKKNAWRVPDEHGSAESLIAEIESEIASRTLALRPIKRYRHREPTNGKLRIIGVESVKQQICDYVAIEALSGLLRSKVGFWQVSSVKGKGQLMAANAVSRWVQEGGYFVHLDVRKCYPSIKADVVMRILRRYVRSPDVLYLCETLLATYGGGLEIGSYFSLRMAQLVLSFGYHAVENMHKVRRGRNVPMVAHQLWYADDIYLFSQDKRNLRSAARQLQRLLLKDFGLHVKPWKVCRVGDQEPVDVVGFTVRRNRVTLRPTLFLRACRAFRKYRRSPTLGRARRVCSYWGWFRNTDSLALVASNRFDKTIKLAKRHVSAAERKKHELSNGIGDAARGGAD